MASSGNDIYDNDSGLASDYARAATSSGNPFFDHVDFVTIRHLVADGVYITVGDLSGKAVMDMACGEGRHCELFSKWGASKVVGYDISESMIDLAKKRQITNSDFIVRDCRKLTVRGDSFDVVATSYALQHMENSSQLLEFLRSAYSCVRPGGRFCGIGLTYAESLGLKGFNSVINLRFQREEVKDFGEVKVVLGANESQGEPGAEIVDHAIFSTTYEKCLKEAGFVDVERRPMLLSEEGKSVFSEADVKELPNYFYAFVARKPEKASS